MGETRDSRGKEEGKAERSRLGEWLGRSIGQRAGWEEPKAPNRWRRGGGSHANEVEISGAV